MLQAIRTLQREVIQTKTENSRKRNILILLLMLVMVGAGITVYTIYRSKKTFSKSVKREEPAPVQKPVENIEPEDEKQAIIEPSDNSDSSVSTPAEGIKHVNRKEDDEVFISLH